MGTTALEAARSGWRPFYWLKISGLPYYFFANVDPTSTSFGSFAWSLPAGYSSVRGMDVPSDTISQALPDLVGGIASAARCRLRLLDLEQTDSNGPYRLFGRLVAPGRARNSSAVKWGLLDADIAASATVGGTFTIRGNQAFPTAPANAYIGQETIGYSAISGIVSGVQTLTIAARQKFPAVDAWNGTTWPPPGLYRVLKDASGVTLPSANIPVSSDAVGLMGRTAALFCGHIDPNGTPTPEVNGVLLIAGRIKSLEYEAGAWLAELESVIADLSTASVAPQLERADILPNQFVVPASPALNTFILGLSTSDTQGGKTAGEIAVSVAAGVYGIDSLCEAINAVLSSASLPSGPWHGFNLVRCVPQFIQGLGFRVAFIYSNISKYVDYSGAMYVRHGISPAAVFGRGAIRIDRRDQSLLTYLGFSASQNEFLASNPLATAGLIPTTQYDYAIFADGTFPSIVLPITASPIAVSLSGPDAPGSRFFTDQGDGSSEAWARLNDGHIVRVTANSAGSVTVDNGSSPLSSTGKWRGLPPDALGDVDIYVSPSGATGTIEQIVIAPDNWIQSPSAALLVGQFMASDNQATAADDFNIYPPGVGLGLGALMSKASWRIGDDIGARRLFVDRDIKLADILTPICKEMGFFVVWDPVAGAITLRQARLPARPGADSFVFNNSNRAAPTDVTKASIDNASMRSGWSIQIGWDAVQQKFVGPTIKVTDYFPINQYGISAKDEKIADKSLERSDQVGAILEELFSKRGKFFEYPWTRMSRSVQKGAIFLAPGTIHQVVDALVHNPYTGAFGITSADVIYGLLTKVAIVPATGMVNVELAIQGREPQSRMRTVAPCGLVDFTANSGGYTNGYKVGPPDTIKMARRYTQNADGSTFDGIDFLASDKIRITSLDNDGTPVYTHSDTIASVDATGLVIGLTTGGWLGLSASLESIIIGETYDATSAAQQLRDPFQGGATDNEVSSGILNFVWA